MQLEKNGTSRNCKVCWKAPIPTRQSQSPGRQSSRRWSAACSVGVCVWGDGVPYLYGIYKTKKERWRPIAGVHKAGQRDQAPSLRKSSAPTHPSHPLAQEMMRMLQVVLVSLEGADRVRMQTKDLRAFWVVRSPQEFGAWVRTHLTE